MDKHCRDDVGVVKTRTSNVEILGELTQAQRNCLGFIKEARDFQGALNICHSVRNRESETVRLRRPRGNRELLAQDLAAHGQMESLLTCLGEDPLRLQVQQPQDIGRGQGHIRI